MHLLDVLVIVLIGFLAVLGAGKGFAKTVFGLVSAVLAIVVASLLASEVGKMFYGFSFAGPTWGESIADGFRSSLSEYGEAFTAVPEGGYTSEMVVAILQEAGIPFILSNLIAPSLCETLVGYENVALVDAVSPILANFVLTAFAFVLLYVIVWAVVNAMAKHAYKAINSFALAKNVDALLGMVIGAIKGILIVWVVLTLCSLFTFIPWINELIQNTSFVKWLADNNLIAFFISSGFDVKTAVEQTISQTTV